jgi:hypothetical protein
MARTSSLGKESWPTTCASNGELDFEYHCTVVQLAMDNLTRNQTPKIMAIKIAASLFKGNWQAHSKTKVVTQKFPNKIVFVSKKLERNTVTHLPKSAKKLDGEETRTVLLNGHKTIPSNHMPNTSKVHVHTYFLKEVRVESFGMTKVPMLEDVVGLSLAVISQVEVGVLKRTGFSGQ